MARTPKTQIAEDGERISKDLPPAGHEHAHPDSIVIDEDAVQGNVETVDTKAEAAEDDDKPVTLTVTKDHSVWDGDGGYYKVGTKFQVNKETAKSLRDKGLAK